MPMQIVTAAAQKGGVGKTTLICHLGIEAERADAGPVAFVDMDPQGSLTDWWNERTGARPELYPATPATLDEVLGQAKEAGAKMVFVDTPPGFTTIIVAAVQRADLVMIPAQPSPVDLRAVGPTIDIVEEQRRRWLFVVNRAGRTRLTNSAASALSKHGVLAPIMLSNLVDFAEAMTDGRTAVEVNPGGTAADQIRELWRVMRDQLADGSGAVAAA
jgi:chromosome partitioning protein